MLVEEPSSRGRLVMFYCSLLPIVLAAAFEVGVDVEVALDC